MASQEELEILIQRTNIDKDYFLVLSGYMMTSKEVEILIEKSGDDIACFLTELDMDGIGLDYLPCNINKLAGVISLDLNRNELICLPDSNSITKLTSLVELDLFGNQLTSLPDGIGILKQLKHLDLESNNLKELPDSSIYRYD
ncbi:Leucine Rich Repeat (LRR)-containing protein [Chamaesiphon minutus PCC 6605]|uniref:Leucine Rich Repeat (LRR)-containing protein n=2 Tax=Chamaesiphon TaxID=217161 RepID=K9UCG7_CHAP6|nr:Leucine Rich Repeat (LRR)-containing protein [Chamaesiphon minutus PCC 6605]